VTLRVSFRFDGLAVVNVALHVHRDIDIDIDRVMRSFTLGKSRHIDVGYGHQIQITQTTMCFDF
jgi:hypothetical protein